MAKVGFTKLGLKKNTNIITLSWNDQIIEIKEYLPIEEKANIIERIINQSIDDKNFASPCRIELYTILEIIFAYTNINFTDKQKENVQELYNLLVGSGLWATILTELKKHSDYDYIINNVKAMIDELYRYKNSVLGVLDAVNQDYSNLSLDAENIQKNLADPNNLAFLKDVVTKLG